MAYPKEFWVRKAMPKGIAFLYSNLFAGYFPAMIIKIAIEVNMKKLSAGLILTDCKKFLACHVTGRKNYDIPKGLVDAGEKPVMACIREAEEETGLNIGEKELVDLGVFEYYRGKDLHLFLMMEKKLPETKNMKCKSFFTDKKGRKLPEVNGFRYINFSEKRLYMIKSMADVLDKVEAKLYII